MPVNRSIEEDKYAVTDTFGDDFDVDARPAQKAESSAVSSGWDAAEKLTVSTGDFPVDFKHSETAQVIRFLDPAGPFASYKQHFLSNKEGKKSYVCLGATCPLCTVLKHRAEDKRGFTIANLSTDPFSRQILTATPRLFKTLSAINSSPQGPINKEGMYWGLSRTGIKQTTVYHVTPIKARDLSDDWNIDQAAAEAAIAAMEPYPASTIRENSYAELLEIAQDLS
jgi:hypothetical protein